MDSKDKSWSEIESNIDQIRISTSLNKVNILLGELDTKQKLENEIVIYSYQQYGVVAPHWVYDNHISNDTISKINSYGW